MCVKLSPSSSCCCCCGAAAPAPGAPSVPPAVDARPAPQPGIAVEASKAGPARTPPAAPPGEAPKATPPVDSKPTSPPGPQPSVTSPPTARTPPGGPPSAPTSPVPGGPPARSPARPKPPPRPGDLARECCARMWYSSWLYWRQCLVKHDMWPASGLTRVLAHWLRGVVSCSAGPRGRRRVPGQQAGAVHQPGHRPALRHAARPSLRPPTTRDQGAVTQATRRGRGG